MYYTAVLSAMNPFSLTRLILHESERCYTEYHRGCDALIGTIKSKHLQIYLGLDDVYECMYEV